MCLISSPAAYSLCSANSTDEPWCGERCNPESAPSTTERARSSKFFRRASETGSSICDIDNNSGARRLRTHALEQSIDDRARADALGLGVEVGDDAVLQRRMRQRAHVVDARRRPPLEDRLGLAAEDEELRGAR